MFDVVLVRGEAREALLEALRGLGYEAVVATEDAPRLPRAGECTVCCSAEHAVKVLRRLYADEDADGLYRYVLAAVEKPLIEDALRQTRGNQVEAARLLGISRNTLRSRIRRLGVDIPGKARQSGC